MNEINRTVLCDSVNYLLLFTEFVNGILEQ